MKFLKMFSLAAVAAAALTALLGVGSASATVLCQTNMTTGCAANSLDYNAGTIIDLSLTGSLVLETLGDEPLKTCTGSTIKGKTTNTGSATETVKGVIEQFTLAGCTKPAIVVKNGEFEIHHVTGQHGAGNGTLTLRNVEITTDGIFGTSCIYGSRTGLNMGVIKGGNPASIGISTVMPRIAGGFLCPAEARLTATYDITSPIPAYVAES